MKLRIPMVCSNVCDIYSVLMSVILCSNVCDIVCACSPFHCFLVSRWRHPRRLGHLLTIGREVFFSAQHNTGCKVKYRNSGTFAPRLRCGDYKDGRWRKAVNLIILGSSHC